jgi:hypothetical protein
MGERKLAINMRVGDRVIWAGHRCVVTATSGPIIDSHRRRCVRLDVDVPELPPRHGLHYWEDEWLECWDLSGE